MEYYSDEVLNRVKELEMKVEKLRKSRRVLMDLLYLLTQNNVETIKNDNSKVININDYKRQRKEYKG